MKILVTGGAGFIGSHIVQHFQSGAEVRVLDNLRTGHIHNLSGFRYEFIRASILDRKAVRQAMQGVDVVFHLAAMVSVPESMQSPVECNEINTGGTLIVLEEAARAKVRKLVFSSSAAIYGDNPETPKSESMMPEPKSPYAITKLDGEFYCNLFTAERHLPTVCLRYFNVFGPRQDPKSPYAAAVPLFIECAAKNKPITIFGDGAQTRDFIFVKEVATANAFFATQSRATGVFNIAGGRRTTVNELVRKISQLFGSRSEIRHVAERPGDVRHSHAAIKKSRAAGFHPSQSLDAGLAATISHQVEVRDARVAASAFVATTQNAG